MSCLYLEELQLIIKILVALPEKVWRNISFSVFVDENVYRKWAVYTYMFIKINICHVLCPGWTPKQLNGF